MINLINMTLFRIGGWKVIGEKPANITKCVVVGAPHTSNFDYFFALGGLNIINAPVKVLIKKDWLKNKLIGGLLINAGAVGVDRSKNNTMVESLAELILSAKEEFYLLIAPEGTRKLTDNWKTGFYHIALKAKVPILLIGLDYKKKHAIVGPSFMPTGCYERDMQILRDFYKDLAPKYPQNFSLKIYTSDSEAVCPD
ncbi:MAG: 1-acyl-sn-glycerol-3-phosphate acyltransferase [Dethiobacteria bacterium]